LPASDTEVPSDGVLDLDFRELTLFAAASRKDKVREKVDLLFLEEILFFSIS
jgi:hypothetical protein